MKLNDKQDYHERTLCQVNREIYRELRSLGVPEDSPVIQKLYEAYDMGKKLNNKLRQYKFNYDDGWWAKHKLDGGKLTDTDDENEITGTPV